MSNKMPTEQEIRVMAENVRQTWSLGISSIERERASKSAHNMLLAIADHLSKSEPVVYYVNAIEDGGSILYVYPPTAKVGDLLYTTPPADAEDARRYRYIKSQMEVGAVQAQLPLHRSVYWIGTYIDCDNVQNVSEAIDAAMNGWVHGDQ